VSAPKSELLDPKANARSCLAVLGVVFLLGVLAMLWLAFKVPT